MAKRNQRPSLSQSSKTVDEHVSTSKSYFNSALVPRQDNHLVKQRRPLFGSQFDDLVDDLIFDMHKGIGGG